MNDEERLEQKLRAIEALFAGATTPGEREAADRARQRITARLAELQGEAQKEFQMTLDPWGMRLLLALARRYGVSVYRYPRQRRGTLVLRGPERFMRETFFPQFDQMSATLYAHLTAVAERVVAQVIDADPSEAAEVDPAPAQLSLLPGPRKG